MEENKDKFKDVMKMAKLEMPFDDFDAKVMAKIEKMEAAKASISKTKKYALIFFVFGTLFGICLNYLIAEIVFPKLSDDNIKRYLVIFSQMIYVILVVLLSDRILRLKRIIRNPEL